MRYVTLHAIEKTNSGIYMDAKFSQRIKDVLSFSKEEAIRLGNNEIAPEHLLLGILREGEGVAIDILVSLGANLYQLKKDIEAIISLSRTNKSYRYRKYSPAENLRKNIETGLSRSQIAEKKYN